jgi:sugar lactone lactonase YvrE
MFTPIRKPASRKLLMTVAALGCLLPSAGCDILFEFFFPSRPIIFTVVGNGVAGDNGDGLAGTDTALYLVQDTTVGPDGLLYFPDWNNHKIRRLNADGTVETIAGTGELGAADDGYGPEIQFNHPTNVEFDGDGNLIVAAWHNSLIKRMNLATGYAETICGTGARSFNGDGLQGTATFVDLPSSVAWDPGTGNIIFTDQANFRIRVLEPSGVVHTIAGDGTPAYSGDGGPAADAQLNSPKGQSAPPAGRLTRTANGEIIFADTGNHVIRKIDGAGIMSLVAGTPEQAGYEGDGGPATSAKLNTPSDVAIGEDGTIYVADTMNHVVREILPDNTIRTLAGTGERGFSGDGGPADEAQLDRPYGLSVGPDGSIFVADTHNHRIRQITVARPADLDTDEEEEPVEIIPCTGAPGSICTYAGTGQKGHNGDGKNQLQTIFYWPIDIEFASNGRQIILDWNNHQVREILGDGTIQTIMGSDFVGDGPSDLSDLTANGADPLTVDLNHPTDIQILPNFDILIVAWHNHKLRNIDADNGRVRVLAGAGAMFVDNVAAKDARFNQPRSAVLTPAGDLFMVDQRNQRVRVLYDFATDRENAFVGTVVGGDANPNVPGMQPGYNGDGAGLDVLLSFATGGNPEPSGGITRDPATDFFYLSDSNNQIIRRIEFLNADFTQSNVVTIAGTPGAAGYSGDNGQATAAKLSNPQDLEIGPDGNLYFADANNNAVRKVDLTTGVITTIAGTGVEGYSGDGGQAVNAQLNRPFGVAFDANGDLYVSDTFNSRVRKVEMVY